MIHVAQNTTTLEKIDLPYHNHAISSPASEHVEHLSSHTYLIRAGLTRSSCAGDFGTGDMEIVPLAEELWPEQPVTSICLTVTYILQYLES
jgi:hypothetical protein